MTFVPPVSSSPSSTAIVLAKKLTELIREFRGSNGGVTDTDIRHALRLTELETGTSLRRGTTSVLMMGMILAGVFVYLLIEATTGSGQLNFSAMGAFCGVLVLGLFLVYLIARR